MPPYQYTRCTEPHFLRKSNLLRAVGVREKSFISSAKLFLQLLDLVIIMKPCRINGKIFEWILISRRSCFRAGVRYYVRGKKISFYDFFFFFWCLLAFLFNAICVIQSFNLLSFMSFMSVLEVGSVGEKRDCLIFRLAFLPQQSRFTAGISLQS